MIYEFKVRKTLSISDFNDSKFSQFTQFITNVLFMLKLKHRQNDANAIFCTTTHMKMRYDLRHKSLLFRFENKTFLKLHKRYNIEDPHKKFENKRCELFLIKKTRRTTCV